MHTEAIDVRDWNPEVARRTHARTGQLVQVQEATWEQLQRAGLVAIIHRVSEASHGIIRSLTAALGSLRWHVWQVIASPDLQGPLHSCLAEVTQPEEMTEKQALEVLCGKIVCAATSCLGMQETSEAYPAEHADEENDAELYGAYDEPPPPPEVPYPTNQEQGVDFDSIVPADLDGLEVEPGYDSLEELPEEDREQLARLANAGVRRSVRRAHAALGHPHKRVLVRMLQLAGASRPAVEYARLWDCPTCSENSMPRRARPMNSSFRPTSFNAAVHVDIKYLRTIDHKLWIFLSMVDAAS
eukprot:4232079-Amphidinium_carterae.1